VNNRASRPSPSRRPNGGETVPGALSGTAPAYRAAAPGAWRSATGAKSAAARKPRRETRRSGGSGGSGGSESRDASDLLGLPDLPDLTAPPKPARARTTARVGGAFFVAAGILLSRVTGLVRQRVFSHYFGLRTDAADAFTAALRIPNFLQNLFGEGALSASFIPVYAALVARGERREADRVAGAVASLLALIVAVVVLIGVVATPLFIDAVAPGFHGPKRELTVALVRILFPGAGLLTMSAWCGTSP